MGNLRSLFLGTHAPGIPMNHPAATLAEIKQQQYIHIHHINIIESLDFLPHQVRTEIFLKLNANGWPQRMCTSNTDGRVDPRRWNEADDQPLMLLHHYELSWASIASTFFPYFTAAFLQERWRVAHTKARADIPASVEDDDVHESSSTPVAKDDDTRNSWPQALRDRVFEAYQAGIAMADVRITYCPDRTEAALTNILSEERKKRGVLVPRKVHNLSTPWTDTEDKQLLALRRGKLTFEEVAARMPGRTRPGCNRRFNDLVAKMSEDEASKMKAMKVARTGWTPGDDKLLLSEREGFQKSFEDIRDAHFSGRTVGGVKARYVRLMEKRATEAKEAKEGQEAEEAKETQEDSVVQDE